MRRFLSPRWLGIHVAMLVIVAGFLMLGWWQLTRAEGGNPLSWGYTFEWPLFAGFVVVFWIRVMRDELRESRAAGASSVPAGGEDVAGGTQEAPAADTASGGGPCRDAEHSAAGAGEDDEDAELAAYNAYLRRLNEEASRAAGSLAARRARRRAAAWSARPDRAGGPDGAARRDGAGGARRGPQLGH